MFDVATALKEVQTKSDAQIELETALKWGSRSIACYQLYKQTQMPSWFVRAEDYRHEALEHAALVQDFGASVRSIQSALDRYRT